MTEGGTVLSVTGDTSLSGAGGSDSHQVWIAKRDEPIWKNDVDGARSTSSSFAARIAAGNGSTLLVFFFLFTIRSLPLPFWRRGYRGPPDCFERGSSLAPDHDNTSGALPKGAGKYRGDRSLGLLLQSS